jgi:hypothetical protein
MAERARNPFEHGPYIQVAAFCERVLRETDGVLSLIRIVDVINHTEAGSNPPKDLTPFHYPLMFVLTLKSGKARGRHEIKIVPELPSGETIAPIIVTVQLEGGGRGTNVTSRVDPEYTMEGLYWFQVWFDEVLLTKVPLQIRYSRLVSGATSSPTS